MGSLKGCALYRGNVTFLVIQSKAKTQMDFLLYSSKEFTEGYTAEALTLKLAYTCTLTACPLARWNTLLLSRLRCALVSPSPCSCKVMEVFYSFVLPSGPGSVSPCRVAKPWLPA